MQVLQQASRRRCFHSSACLSRPPSAKNSSARANRQQQPQPSSSSAASSSRRSKTEERFNFNPNPFDNNETQDLNLASYPLLTAKQLSPFALPPKRVRLLVRDFIDDALYNPNYGYFTQQAVIFDPDQHKSTAAATQDQTGGDHQATSGFDFNGIKNSAAFDQEVAARYGALEGEHGATALPGKDPTSARQVWHTPTELFKPWYARAVARFLVAQFQQRPDSESQPLLIYELGAGNGTLMRGVLDYLAESEPLLYQRTTYHIIEISPRLSELQQERAGPDHSSRVHVINQDVFAYTGAKENRDCFFLAFEVLDNLAHDLVRFTKDPQSPPQPVQATVSISSSGDFVELYTPVEDPLIAEYLHLRSDMPLLPPLHPERPQWWRSLEALLPASANLSQPYFVPTKLLKLLKMLHEHFPKHRLLLSDFSSLPDAIPGHTAPVVQTRYKGQTVPCTTYLVQQGFFDIFFPTDFAHLQHLYDAVARQAHRQRAQLPDFSQESLAKGSTKQDVQRSGLDVLSHRDFLEQWGEVDRTQLRNGDNPMLDHYENAAFAFTRHDVD